MSDLGEDFDVPPASDDPVVQNYIETNWREALRGSREAMECIRKIWPELTQHLPETAAVALKDALDSLQAATRKLHKAGPHVLGQEEYDTFMEAQTLRQIRS